jgi:hypothetical protein
MSQGIGGEPFAENMNTSSIIFLNEKSKQIHTAIICNTSFNIPLSLRYLLQIIINYQGKRCIFRTGVAQKNLAAFAATSNGSTSASSASS